MGRLYEWDENPLRDFLFRVMLLDNDITDSKYEEGIETNIEFILSHMGVNDYDLRFLDYKFKEKKKGYIQVQPQNLVSAMWFIGALPYNCNIVNKRNSIDFNGKTYKFNKRTKRLTWVNIKK